MDELEAFKVKCMVSLNIIPRSISQMAIKMRLPVFYSDFNDVMPEKRLASKLVNSPLDMSLRHAIFKNENSSELKAKSLLVNWHG